MNEVPKALHSNPECIQAKEDELQKLQQFDVYEETEDHGQVCIGTRWVLTYKGSSVKARLVAKGFQEKERVPSDSLTVAKTALRTRMALAASNCWEIMTTDIKSAFLQGKEVGRDIFIRPPKEANVSPGWIWRLKKTVYGLNDGSRQFYLPVREFLISCGCEVSTVDPSVFFYMHAGELFGVIVSHVDDFLHSGSHLFNEKVMEPLRQRFIAGKIEAAEFKYVGFAVRQGSNGIQLNMDEYIDGIHPTKITPGEEDRPLTEEEASEYRSIVGRLNWIAQGARPDKSFSVIELSTKFRKPTLRDLNQAVRIMRKVKEVKSAVHFPELGSSLSLKVFTDAAHGNLPDGFSSTMGLVVFFAGNGRLLRFHGVQIRFGVLWNLLSRPRLWFYKKGLMRLSISRKCCLRWVFRFPFMPLLTIEISLRLCIRQNWLVTDAWELTLVPSSNLLNEKWLPYTGVQVDISLQTPLPREVRMVCIYCVPSSQGESHKCHAGIDRL